MQEQDSQVDENELVAQRREKLEHWRAAGQAYPNTFNRDSLAAEVLSLYQAYDQTALAEQARQVALAGRIVLRRVMGKASFLHIQDMSGRIQIYVRADDIPAEHYAAFKTWDIGDIIGVVGQVFKTKTGELSVHAHSIELLTKALRPLPDKFHGLSSQELCYRQRYLDLMVNPHTRNTFLLRTRIINHIREFLQQRNFLEVETPMMQVLPGGAVAKPFITHHNALDMPLFLRVAPELYLKRLVVGGLERVFEINRNFRNEGLSTRHNPEFTMLEFYQAYANYADLMDLTEVLLRELAHIVFGQTQFTYQGTALDFAQPFARLTMTQALLDYNPSWSAAKIGDHAYLCELAAEQGIAVGVTDGVGKLQFALFEATVEARLLQPTFITAHPAETSPLARRNDNDASITDRFELFIAGREIANGFSELNDPDIQAACFREQVKAKDAGDHEAMYYDADYIQALEYGLPPTAGEGIGIDRLVMLLTDAASIRDVILFPHLRPL